MLQITVTVETADVATYGVGGLLRVERGPAWAEFTTVALVAGQTIIRDNGGTDASTYRTRYSTAVPTVAGDYSDYSAERQGETGARSTMATLITRLRLAVGDPESLTQAFSDDELQGFLDNHRVEVRTVELRPVVSVADGGAVSYLEYAAPRGFWEDSPHLQSNTYATLTPTTSDLLAGRWTFAVSQLGPVFITGQSYDLYGAAVEALEAWAARESAAFDFTEDGQSFSRSQKGAARLASAREYARRAGPSGARLIDHSGAW